MSAMVAATRPDWALNWTVSLCLTLTIAALCAPSLAQASTAGAAAHDAQNPIANVISLPFQNDTYFETGPYRRTANALLVQPVYPIKLNDDWNVITRTITPLVYQPRLAPFAGSEAGLGNLEPQFYLSPTHPGNIIWGVGPALWLPTATDKTLGVNKWGGGPAAVVLTIHDPWLVGALVNNVWAGSEGARRVNQMTLNPFVFYNFSTGWYLFSSPVITSNWRNVSIDRLTLYKGWTVPIGGGVGRLFKIGDQPINARFQFFDNVERPNYAPRYELQLQIQFLFPA